MLAGDEHLVDREVRDVGHAHLELFVVVADVDEPLRDEPAELVAPGFQMLVVEPEVVWGRAAHGLVAPSERK